LRNICALTPVFGSFDRKVHAPHALTPLHPYALILGFLRCKVLLRDEGEVEVWRVNYNLI